MKESLRKKLGIEKEDIIVSYLGSIGGWYLTNEMMQFCKVISDKNSRVRFLFISPHRHEVIASAGSKYGLSPSKIIVCESKRHEVPILLSLSDYSLFFIMEYFVMFFYVQLNDFQYFFCSCWFFRFGSQFCNKFKSCIFSFVFYVYYFIKKMKYMTHCKVIIYIE